MYVAEGHSRDTNMSKRHQSKNEVEPAETVARLQQHKIPGRVSCTL